MESQVRMLHAGRVLLVLIACGLALCVWQKNTHTLVQSVEKLSKVNPEMEMPGRGIFALYQAENHFRLYLATYQRSYFEDYSRKLHEVSGIIDSIRLLSVQRVNTGKIGLTLEQKTNITNTVISLKRLTDSLLTVAGQWDTNSYHKPQLPAFDLSKIQNLHKKSSVDSILDNSSTQKQGFFKKVKKLFRDDHAPQRKSIIVKHTEEVQDSTVASHVKATPEYALQQEIQAYYSDKINSYTDGRSRLDKNERALASVNEQIIEEIVKILNQIKIADLETANAIKENAIRTSEKSALSISLIAAISVLIAVVFFFILTYYMKKIKVSAKNLEHEKLKAENLSLQKTRFLSGMSHEIRAPLNNIMGFTEQLRSAPAENQDKYLTAIHTSADLMLSTVNQILDFSSLEAGKMSFDRITFHPFKAIQSAAGTMILMARNKNLKLSLQLPAMEDIKVSGDEFRLKQVIVNLIDNAVKYTEAGEISVRASLIPYGEGYQLYLEIADTGMGIPANKVNDIFNEFERLEENESRRWKPGTGLGLPIARKVIEQQGGKIYVKETSEKGSVFAVELPYARPREQESSVAKPGLSHTIPAGKTILLAEDDSFSILLIKTICKKHHIRVISAENGQIAFELLSQNKIDLILTDINMPVLSGLDFTRKLRATEGIASIPVIAVTASVMNDDVERMKSAGFSEILFKPFRENEFIEKISLFLH